MTTLDASDPLGLTRSLLARDTVNPPGNEPDRARPIAALLEQWGYAVRLQEFAPGRCNLVACIARIARGAAGADGIALVFTAAEID